MMTSMTARDTRVGLRRRIGLGAIVLTNQDIAKSVVALRTLSLRNRHQREQTWFDRQVLNVFFTDPREVTTEVAAGVDTSALEVEPEDSHSVSKETTSYDSEDASRSGQELVLLQDAKVVDKRRQPTMGMAQSDYLLANKKKSAHSLTQKEEAGAAPESLVPAGAVDGATPDYFWWFRMVTFGCMIKALSIASSLCTQFAPLPEVTQMREQKKTGSKEALSYVAIACTGLQWCMYGTSAYLYTGNHGFLIVVYANVVGACMGCYYSFTFYQHVDRSTRQCERMQLYMGCAVTLFTMQLLFYLTRPLEQFLLASGCLSATLSVVVTLSPLATLPTVLRTRSVESMPVELSLVSFGSSWLWLACGLMLHDWWILIPNYVGIAVGFVSCYLIFGFADRTGIQQRKMMQYPHDAVSSMAAMQNLSHECYARGRESTDAITLVSHNLCEPSQSCAKSLEGGQCEHSPLLTKEQVVDKGKMILMGKELVSSIRDEKNPTSCSGGPDQQHAPMSKASTRLSTIGEPQSMSFRISSADAASSFGEPYYGSFSLTSASTECSDCNSDYVMGGTGES
ncbi:unnamed protein product [Amoebophrya sp. A25]|nr:unnamed protein product [Amoebophrya sp. A25]|eukprot:GSA25T00002326001.1